MFVTAPQTDWPRQAASRPDRAVFAGLEVCRNPLDALAVWRTLAPAGRGSFYQSEKFLLAWLEHLGAKEKVEPFFIVARDACGAPLALLPLGLFRFGPLRVAQFLGGKHANYNLGLFRGDAAFSARDLRLLLREAARAKGGPHLYCLLNMPLFWRGAANPLTLLPHRSGADHAYATALGEDGDAWLATRLSAATRKKWRKKEKRLAGMGELSYFRAKNQAQAQEILDSFFRQKSRRFAGLADQAKAAATQDFYAALSSFGAEGAAPAVELHALTLGGRVIATLAAGLNGGRLQALFNSFDADPPIAQCSPGEILLSHVLRDACARKVTAFDLGLGDARYKKTFCDDVESMADTLFAPSFFGLLAQPFFVASLVAKTTIKQNPSLWRLFDRMRRGQSLFRSN
ncbi:GNAT family N-acetyltransferase [Rhodoblastus sp.]|uniref:GNAT family N-acetyltransferase n=1 Tax=Rhodoblastus sp. TaxID=1962975 RepID=UPI003F97C0E8